MPTLRLAIDSQGMISGASVAGSALDRVSVSGARAAGVLDRVSAVSGGLGNSIGGLNAVLGPAIAALTASAGIIQAVTAIKDYDESMTSLRVSTGATTEEMVKFNYVTKQTAVDSVFGAFQITKSLDLFANSGLSAAQSLYLLTPSLNLATAGETTLNIATRAVLGSLTQFGLQIGEAGRAADILETVARDSIASVEGLGESLKRVGPFAHLVGVSLEDTSSAIGVLAKNAIIGTTAGSNLRSILARLVNPSEEAQKALHKVGLEAEDINASTIGLGAALRNLVRSNIDSTGLTAVFGRLNVTATSALLNNLGFFEELQESLKSSEGNAENWAREIKTSLNSAVQSLKATVEVAYISLGEAGLNGLLKTVVLTSKEVIEILAGIKDQTVETSSTVVNLVAGVKALAAGLTALAAVKSIQILFFGLTALLTPVGILVGLITAAAFALFKFKDEVIEFEGAMVDVGDVAGAVWEYISERAKTFFTIFKSVAKLTWQVFSQLMTNIVNGFNETMRTLEIDWGSMVKFLGSAFKEGINLIIGTFRFLGNVVSEVLTRVVDFVTTFNTLKFGSFDEFTKSVEVFRDTFAHKLSGPSLIDAIKTAGIQSFGKDYVAELGKSFKTAGTSIRDFVLRDTGIDIELELGQGVNLDKILESLKKRSVALRDARIDEEIAHVLAGKALSNSSISAEELRANMSALVKDLGEADDPIEDVSKAIEESFKKALESINDVRTEQLGIEATIDSMERLKESGLSYNELLRQTQDSEQELAEVRRFMVSLGDIEIEQSLILGQTYTKELLALQKLRREKEAILKTAQLANALKEELDVALLSNDERARAIALRNFENAAVGLSVEQTRELSAAYAEQYDNLVRLEKGREVARSIAESFGEALTSIKDDIGSTVDAVQTLYKAISDAIFQALFIKPIVDQVGNGLGSLFGTTNLFGGGFKLFANGGITNGPEAFPIGHGRIGVRGEAGPEAVVPLPDGRTIPVTLRGGGSSTVINQTFNVSTPDVGGFRKSRRQLMADGRRSAGV